jgi:hypothetical protein
MSLDELRRAAARMLADDAEGRPPDPRDADACATFVRDLLGRRVAGDVPDEVKPFRRDVSILGFIVSRDDALDIATQILRAAESAGSLPGARVHEEPHGRPGR